MKYGWVSLFAVIAIPAICCAQDISVGNVTTASGIPSPSQTIGSAKVPFSGALVNDARCDADGNIYIRILDAETSKQPHPTTKLPIRKIKPDGTLIGVFRFADALPDLSARDFFVTSIGKVYLEAWGRSDERVYILEFDNDGSLKSTIPLDTPAFSPRQIVVFGSGEFLLSGTYGESNHTPFTAVFGANGKLLKKVYEPEDEYSRKQAAAGDPDFVREGFAWDNIAVVHGDAALGTDGNAYLLRATSPALIYVISPKGELVRKLKIDSPSSGLVARTLKSAEGKLAIGFLESDSSFGVVKIVDLQGNQLTTYTSNDRTTYPGLPGCYDARSFTFLHAGAENAVTLHKTELK